MKCLSKGLLTVLVLIFIFSSIGISQGAEIVMKIGMVDPPNPFRSSDFSFATVFKNYVETSTNGEIQVELYPASQLGKERESMELLKSKIIQGYIATNGALAPFFPLLGVTEIPFSIPSFEVAYKVFDGEFGEEFSEKIVEETGLKCLAIMEQGGFFHLTNNVRPLKLPEDMKGIKFRTMTLPSHINFFESMGASAVPISWAEVYTSLQTGVADGQHNPINPIRNAKLYEVQKYMTLTNHLYSTHWFLVNDEWFNNLSEKYQKIMEKGAARANMASRGLNRVMEAAEDTGLPLLAREMEIYKPTSEELEAFAEIAVPAAKEFVKEDLGDEGLKWVNKYLEAIEKAKKELTD